MDEPFVKQRSDAPPGFFEVEAAGLRWLARAPGGVPVVPVVDVGPGRLVLGRVPSGRPGPAAAREFGRRLAATHRAGADWWGQGPPGWDGDGFVGDAPMTLPAAAPASWGSFFARHRLQPYLRAAVDAGSVDVRAAHVVERVCERLDRGDPDLVGAADEPVARLHGDLWSGNVLWSPDGAVLVDPAAHGGHRESDLAMLHLFGLPHLDDVVEAYDDAWPPAPGRGERLGLHQLFPLLVHAVLFGPGYGARAVGVARKYV